MKRYKYITSIGVIAIVLSLSITSIITKDKEKSDLEMRNFQIVPTFNNLVRKEKTHNFNAYAYGLLTGNIFESWDKYFSDHISLRNTMVNTFNGIQSVLKKEYINEVVLGQDNYLFPLKKNEDILSREYLINRANYFNDLVDKLVCSKLYMVNLPTKEMVYENKFPIKEHKVLKSDYIDTIFRGIDRNEINTIDCRKVLNNKEELYYKTDHHWNMEGTYNGYRYIIDELRKEFPQIKEANDKEFYNIEEYKECFIGSDGRKVSQFVKEKENLKVFRYENEKDFDISINGEKGSFFYEKHLDESKSKNDYSIYLDADNPEVIVRNLKSNNDLKIVMIGDSMDNPLVPLMAYHFNELYSYDLRDYDKSIIEKINEIKPDIIMLIGLTDSFIGDKGKIFDIK